MDGEELAGTVGGDPQLVAAVGVEVALAQGDRDAGNCAVTMFIVCMASIVQIII